MWAVQLIVSLLVELFVVDGGSGLAAKDFVAVGALESANYLGEADLGGAPGPTLPHKLLLQLTRRIYKARKTDVKAAAAARTATNICCCWTLHPKKSGIWGLWGWLEGGGVLVGIFAENSLTF